MISRCYPASATPPPALKINCNGHLNLYGEDSTLSLRLKLPRHSVFEVISMKGRFWGSLDPVWVNVVQSVTDKWCYYSWLFRVIEELYCGICVSCIISVRLGRDNRELCDRVSRPNCETGCPSGDGYLQMRHNYKRDRKFFQLFR